MSTEFAERLTMLTGESCASAPLGEADHDFELRKAGEVIEVQAVEIVSRDYLHDLSSPKFLKGHNFRSMELLPNGKTYGVDKKAEEAILWDRIRQKIEKHYAKSQSRLWLLVWTVASFMPFWIEDQQARQSTGVDLAQSHLAERGTGPFDEIWFFKLGLAPHRIWPR